ncbi:S8 family peptidase [Clostridium sp.]|uniref:S8 family peptidase n=1 Tax=Clostridium sp. TaxID=1506 RepID=UPI003F2FEEE3
MAKNNKIFSNPEYIHIIIEYSGNLIENGTINPGIDMTIINDQYAIISIKESVIPSDLPILNYLSLSVINGLIDKYFIKTENFNVISVLQPQIFTLQEISAIDAAEVNFLQANLPLNLTGKGVIVGIIDTGIDYLNEEFRDSSGKSRIISIWDQTIISDSHDDETIPFGKIYNNEQINKAIEVYESKGNPYDIVPSKDEYGHGTAMAGIVGARGKNKDIKGIAPECEFAIVKLVEFNRDKEILEVNNPLYGLVSIFTSIEYLKKMSLKAKKPIVILLPLGSNNGNHKGDSIFDSYIEKVSSNVGIVIVTGAGNEGDQDGHVSGIISNKSNDENIELMIREKQKYMLVDIWIDLPNIVEVNLISPSGEETGFVHIATNEISENSFVFEKSKSEIRYFIPEEYTGEEFISIYFKDISPGIWVIKLKLRSGEMAKFNAWLLQRGVVKPGTRFAPSDPFGTITVPGDSDFVVTVAAYNQNNKNMLSYSGSSFRDEFISKIDFAAGGVNTLTVGLNNTTRLINGTSLAAAVGAGACVLLFEWGITQGNYPYMYSQSIKTFLRRGVIRRGKEVYPNQEWGYGIINFYKIFENMI